MEKPFVVIMGRRLVNIPVFLVNLNSAASLHDHHAPPPTNITLLRKHILPLLLLGGLVLPCSLSAQFYPNRVRPASIEWRQIESETFRVIYPAGAEAQAIRSAELLSTHYPVVSQRLGAQLRSFPLVLNPSNSLSNGFVSPLNFRSEIELNPIKGKFLNPRSGPWLETVIPHELVHAVHNEIVSPGSITSQIGLFSSDIRRAIHSFVPLGLHEGIAVDYESHGIGEGMGRGNYPYFTLRHPPAYDAKPWSMGQMFHISMETLPYDRHYVGGYAFMNWLRETYSQQAINESIRKQHAAPLFGYGLSLRRVTGKWPGALHEAFLGSLNDRSSITLASSARLLPLQAPYALDGVQVHRPLWIGEDELVIYAESYNHPSGFFRHRLEEKGLEFIAETRIVEDHHISLLARSDEDGAPRDLLFASYIPSRLYDSQWRSSLHRLPLSSDKGSGKGGYQTLDLQGEGKDRSLYAPAPHESGLLAVMDHSFGSPPSLVRLTDGGLETLTPDGVQIIQAATKQGQSEIAIVAKVAVVATVTDASSSPESPFTATRGVQGIWFFDPAGLTTEQVQTRLEERFNGAPDIGFETGSIFDAVWHPKNDALMFSSDASGVFSLYVLDRAEGRLSRLVLSNGNVFEGDWSPSGNSIAAVVQMGQTTHPFVVQTDVIQTEYVAREIWSATPSYWASTNSSSTPPPSKNAGVPPSTLPPGWTYTSKASDLSWLRPRMWFPYVGELSGDLNEIGVQVSGTDVLSEKTYSALLSTAQERVWGGVSFAYSGFWPGVKTSLESRPSVISYLVPDAERPQRDFLLRQRGGDISLPLHWNLSQGTHRSSSLLLQPRFGVEGLTFLAEDITAENLTQEQWMTELGMSGTLSLGLHQRARNPQPERGTILYTQFDRSVGGSGFEFSDSDYTYRGSFNNRYGFRAGVMQYLPLLRSLSQSLLLQAEFIEQSDVPMYDLFELTNRLVEGRSGEQGNDGVYSRVRATLPLKTVDNGGLLVPIYLGSLYLAVYHQAYVPITGEGVQSDAISHGVGGGIRFSMKFGNIGFDFGIGAFYSLSDGEAEVVVGSF